LWAANDQFVALYGEEACLVLICTGVDFVPGHIDPDHHPVSFNGILPGTGQHRVEQSCLPFRILGGSAIGSRQNDQPSTVRREYQPAFWVRTERFDGIPSVKPGNQRNYLPGSSKLFGSIVGKRKSRPEQAATGKEKRKTPFHAVSVPSFPSGSVLLGTVRPSRRHGRCTETNGSVKVALSPWISGGSGV